MTIFDQVFKSIISVLTKSGYRLTVGKITLEFLDFQMKADNKKYSNPELDPTLHNLDLKNSFFIEVLDSINDTVGTIAGRKIETDFLLSACRTYEFWYGDRIHFSEPLNIVYADYDRTPRGTVAYDGAMWVRPDHRNRGLSWALSRLCRLTAIRMWNPDWIFGFGFQAVTQAQLPTSVYGYPRCEMFATGFKFPGYPAQTIYLATMTLAEAVQTAAEDWRFLSGRPDLVLDHAFANELRMRRKRESLLEKMRNAETIPRAAIA